MSIYEQKPWLSLYDRDQPAEISLGFTDALSMFRAAVSRNPDGDIIRYFGGTVKAYVSLRPGQTATAEELIAFCREQMAAYKYPRQVEFLDELPKTVSGKLLRRELRDRD